MHSIIVCPIRQCALRKEMGTCGDCAEIQTCEKVGMILGNSEEARRNLEILDKADAKNDE